MHPHFEMPAYQLTAADFQSTPVWRFMSEAELDSPDADESFVCANETQPQWGEYASYLVRATYTLKNGSSLPGFVEVAVLGKRVEFTPSIVFAKGKSVEALGKDTALRLQRILKLDDSQPMAWVLDVCICGEHERRQSRIQRPGLLQAFSLLIQLLRLHRTR